MEKSGEMEKILDALIELIEEDVTEALGCTEPVAVAYCANVAGGFVDRDKTTKIDVYTSKNVYKNGKSVKIPNTGACGLDLAATVGVFAEKSEHAMQVFGRADDEVIARAKAFVADGKVRVAYLEDTPDIYVRIELVAGEDRVTAELAHSHTHIERVVVNGETVLDNEKKDAADVETSFDMRSLSFAKLREIIDEAPFEKLAFTLDGVDVNMRAAMEGLKGYGSKLGKTLNELKKTGVLADHFVTDARILTAAAADMRMGGGNASIMTSGGSGNQGIGVILPIAVVAKEEGASDDKLARAIFFGHAINRYVKEYSGKLSGICGCAIASGIGASAGIVYLLGGTNEQIAGACQNLYANLTGMICDGAKESCALKLSTSAEEAILSAYLAKNGVVSEKGVGVLGNTIEETVLNIGKLSRKAFTHVDEEMLKIIGE